MPDTDTTVRRRTLLRTVGATTAASALAGCFSSDDGDDSDLSDPKTKNDGAGTEPERMLAGAEPCATGAVPDGNPVTTIDDDISEDLTLEAGLHRVTDHVEIEGGGTLTIEPGAIVVFAKDAGLIVRSEGTLTAVGTCEEPILLTGDETIRGYWHGLFFDNSMKTDNRLEYVVVEYGGNAEGNSYSEEPNAAVGLYGESYVSIDHCTLRESPRYGLRYGPDATLASCEQNAFTRNADAGVQARANGVHSLDPSSTYTGNESDRIRVLGGWGSGWGGRIGENQSVTWQKLDVHYHVVPTSVNGQFDVEGELTIEPETEIVFAQDMSMRAVDSGSISLEGGDPNDYDPITLTGEREEPGFWRGVFFMDTESTGNTISNAVIEYGGRDTFRSAPRAGNLVVQGNTRLDVEDTTLRQSAGYGLSTGPWVEFGNFERNTVIENEDAPVNSWATAAHYFTPSNSYTGNGTDEIRLWGGYATFRDGGGPIPEDRDVTWNKLAVDYRVVQRSGRDETQVHGNLTIDPGVTIRFAERGGLETRGNGSITAAGTEDEPITFTGTDDSVGFWGGIHFVYSRNDRNELRNVVIEGAGSHNPYRLNRKCSVSATDGGKGTVADSGIRNGKGVPFAVLQPEHEVFDEHWSDLYVSNCTVDGKPYNDVLVDTDPRQF